MLSKGMAHILYNKLPKIDINDLKVGDKVYIAYPAMVGWHTFRYPTFKEFTVKRITPKKTKIYLANETSSMELTPSKTYFYQDCPELHQQNQIAQCAQECNRLIFKIDSNGQYLHRLSDDEFLEIHKLLARSLEILEKAANQ